MRFFKADNFEREQLGMRIQLAQLREIIAVLDRPLFNHLAKHDALNMFFCFRWILLNFKREFELADTHIVWEVRLPPPSFRILRFLTILHYHLQAIWSRHMSEYFHLFIAAAILLGERRKIIGNDMAFDDVLRHTNSLAGEMNTQEVLIEAERLYKKYLMFTNCVSDDELRANMMKIEAEIRPPKRSTPANIFDAVRSG